jgi:hypothetical protein
MIFTVTYHSAFGVFNKTNLSPEQLSETIYGKVIRLGISLTLSTMELSMLEMVSKMITSVSQIDFRLRKQLFKNIININ